MVWLIAAGFRAFPGLVSTDRKTLGGGVHMLSSPGGAEEGNPERGTGGMPLLLLPPSQVNEDRLT